MRRKSVDSTHIFIQFASEFQCYTEVISVVPQDISVKATHRDKVDRETWRPVQLSFEKAIISIFPYHLGPVVLIVHLTCKHG